MGLFKKSKNDSVECKNNSDADTTEKDVNSKPVDNGKKKKKRIIITAIILAIIVIILLLLSQCHNPTVDAVKQQLNIANNAQDQVTETSDKDAIQKQLNDQVDASKLCISMSTNPIFADSKSEGMMQIKNDASNRYLMVVEIYRDDTGEEIYKTDAIPIGKEIVKDKLQVELPKGDYKCTAYFNAYDPQTQAFMGKAGAKIVITIQN